MWSGERALLNPISAICSSARAAVVVEEEEEAAVEKVETIKKAGVVEVAAVAAKVAAKVAAEVTLAALAVRMLPPRMDTPSALTIQLLLNEGARVTEFTKPGWLTRDVAA